MGKGKERIEKGDKKVLLVFDNFSVHFPFGGVEEQGKTYINIRGSRDGSPFMVPA